MPKVIHTKLRKDGRPRKRNNIMWSPEKQHVYVIVGSNGMYFNPDKDPRWDHRPKLYKARADALKAIGLHCLHGVGIWEYSLTLTNTYVTKCVEGKDYGKWKGVINEQR